MTYISKVGRPAKAAGLEGLYWLDAVIEFINIEKFLISRMLAFQSKGHYISGFSLTIRYTVVVLAHIVFFQAINRGLPGSVSYLEFVAGGFFGWMTFNSTAKKGTPSLIQLPANVPFRIRWINMLVADFVWILLKLWLGLVVLYVAFFLFRTPIYTGLGMHPNFAMLALVSVLAGLLGTGVGMAMHAVTSFVPALDGFMEVFMWIVFVSSGVYDAYCDIPSVVRPYFAWNPVLTINEYARLSLHPGYPVLDLNLMYPAAVAFGLIVFGFSIRRRLGAVEVP